MSISFNQTSITMTSVTFRSTVFDSCQQNPAQAAQALQQLQQLFQTDSLLRGGRCGGGQSLESAQGLFPGRPCIPAPALEHSGAPAGKGLTTSPEGWPAGSVQTAGGYTIVPEGSQAAWSIFAPGQKPGETPNTRIWGDPHVSEKDGTRWDFTKNSDFVLPDGTRINCQTTSETGQSVSKGLTIANGADKVQIDGINTGSPTTGAVTQDGYQWRAQHLAENPGRDSFHLGGSADNVKWFKETNGQNLGEITGAHLDRNTNRYEQITNGEKNYWVDPNLRPALGSEAWGNQLRSQLSDLAGQWLPPQLAELAGAFIGVDHAQAELSQSLRQLFGGWGSQFGGFGHGFGAVQGLGDMMMLQAQLAMALGAGRYGGILA